MSVVTPRPMSVQQVLEVRPLGGDGFQPKLTIYGIVEAADRLELAAVDRKDHHHSLRGFGFQCFETTTDCDVAQVNERDRASMEIQPTRPPAETS